MVAFNLTLASGATKSVVGTLADALAQCASSGGGTVDLPFGSVDQGQGECNFLDAPGVTIRGMGPNTIIDTTSTTPLGVAWPSMAGYPTETAVDTEVLGCMIHSRTSKLQGVSLENLTIRAHKGTPAASGVYALMNIVADDVKLSGVSFVADASDTYDSTQNSRFKAASARNFTVEDMLLIGPSRWLEPDPDTARSCSRVVIERCSLNGEPLGDTAGATPVLRAVHLRMCANVHLRDLAFGEFYTRVDRRKAEVVLSSNPSKNETVTVLDWDMFKKEQVSRYFAFFDSPAAAGYQVAHAKFSAVPTSGSSATIFKVTSKSAATFNINTRNYSGSPPSDSAPNYYLDTNGVATVAAFLTALVAKIAAITSVNVTPTATGAGAGAGVLRLVDKTSGVNDSLVTITSNPESKLSIKIIEREAEIGATKVATSVALAGVIATSNVNYGGRTFLDAVTAQQSLPGAPTTVAWLEVRDAIVNPNRLPNKPKARLNFARSSAYVSSDSSAVAATSISTGRRRTYSWETAIEAEDCNHVQGKGWVVGPTNGMLFDQVATRPMYDLTGDELAEDSHSILDEIQGEGFTHTKGIIRHRAAGFFRYGSEIEIGQSVPATQTIGAFDIREGTHKGFRVKCTSANVVDGSYISINDGQGTTKLFEFDVSANGVTAGRAAVTGTTDNNTSLRSFRAALEAQFMAHGVLAFAKPPVQSGTDYYIDIHIVTHLNHGSPAVTVSNASGSALTVTDISQPYYPHSYFFGPTIHWLGFIDADGQSYSCPALTAQKVTSIGHISANVHHVRPMQFAQSNQAEYSGVYAGNVTTNDTIVIDDKSHSALTFKWSTGTDLTPANTYYAGAAGADINTSLRNMANKIMSVVRTGALNCLAANFTTGGGAILKVIDSVVRASGHLTVAKGTDAGSVATWLNVYNGDTTAGKQGPRLPFVITDCCDTVFEGCVLAPFTDSQFTLATSPPTFLEVHTTSQGALAGNPWLVMDNALDCEPMQMAYLVKNWALPMRATFVGNTCVGPFGSGRTDKTALYDKGGAMSDSDVFAPAKSNVVNFVTF